MYNLKLVVSHNWSDFFMGEVKKPYFTTLYKRLTSAYRNRVCYPPFRQIFRVFDLITPPQVKVIIIGQDPYYRPHQADGLAFSNGSLDRSLPRSLYNIFCELQRDLKINHFNNGSLTGWVRSGVLLINTIWSVEAGRPASHHRLGWQTFTVNLLDYVIRSNSGKEKLVLVGWGAKAQAMIKPFLHRSVIPVFAAHPSPLSYHRFKSSQPFSKINNYLLEMNLAPINWAS